MAFINHHRKFNSSTFMEHALEGEVDSLSDNESESALELGIICMQIRAFLRETEESDGLQRFMKEVLSYVTDKADEDVGCGTCEQYLFLGAFVKCGLKSKLDGGSLSLLQRAFCVDETFSSVRAVNFVKWLEAGGRDDERESTGDADAVNNVVFEDRELIFNMVTVEGSALKLKSAHDVYISITIGGNSYVASVFPSKEKGTGKRTFKVDWKPISVSAETFRSQKTATLTMTASPQNSEEKFEVSDTVTLTRFMVAIKAAFEVSIVLPAPRLPGDKVDSAANSQKSGSENSDTEEIRITLYGTAREASQAAMRRISLMKSEDLIRVTFDPLPADDDFSSPSSSTCTSPRHGSPDKFKSSSTKGDGKAQEDLGIIDEDEDQSADHAPPNAEPDTPQSEQSDMGESISTDGSEKGQPQRRASTKNTPSDNIQRRNKAVVSKQPELAVTPTPKSSAPVEVEDEEIDYDIDFSPDSVSMAPDAPLSPRRRERPKSAVKEQKKTIAPTKISEKVQAAPKKVEVMVDSNEYEDDEYEVDFE